VYSTGIYNKEPVLIVTNIVQDVQGLHYKIVKVRPKMIVLMYNTGIDNKETALIVAKIVKDVQGLHFKNVRP